MTVPRQLKTVNLNSILMAQSMSSAGTIILSPKHGDYILARMPPDYPDPDLGNDKGNIAAKALGARDILRQAHNGYWCIAECGPTVDYRAKLARVWTAHNQEWRPGEKAYYDFTAIKYVFSGQKEAEETIKLFMAFNAQEEIVNAMARARAAVVEAVIAGDALTAQNITHEHNKLIDQIKDAGLIFATKLKMLEG